MNFKNVLITQFLILFTYTNAALAYIVLKDNNANLILYKNRDYIVRTWCKNEIKDPNQECKDIVAQDSLKIEGLDGKLFRVFNEEMREIDIKFPISLDYLNQYMELSGGDRSFQDSRYYWKNVVENKTQTITLKNGEISRINEFGIKYGFENVDQTLLDKLKDEVLQLKGEIENHNILIADYERKINDHYKKFRTAEGKISDLWNSLIANISLSSEFLIKTEAEREEWDFFTKMQAKIAIGYEVPYSSVRQTKGFLEYKQNGKWRPVCFRYTNYEPEVSDIFCKMMGKRYNQRWNGNYKIHVPVTSDDYALNSFWPLCRGNEESINDCNWISDFQDCSGKNEGIFLDCRD